MVEPSEELKQVFERSIKDARAMGHEYVTLEHLLNSIITSEIISNQLEDYGADVEYIRTSLETYLATELGDIRVENSKMKPKKTQTVERVLNRAFTQTLFSGRGTIDIADVVLSILAEKKSQANYILEMSGIEKDSLNEFLHEELDDDDDESEESSTQAQRALKSFTTLLNREAQKNRIDPVIGRQEEVILCL